MKQTVFEGRTNMCCRVTRFRIDGVYLCTQHAGEE